jgi:hypothetical protein
MMRSFLISVLVGLPVYLGAFEQIDHMHQILPKVTHGTLVMFDVDDTLIEPIHEPTDMPAGQALAKRLRQDGRTPKESEREAAFILGRARVCAETRPVEPSIPPMVSDLQHRGIAVMGLTARSSFLGWLTHIQLGTNNFDLRRTPPGSWGFDFRVGDAYTGYVNGIVYCDHADKGATLIEFLTLTNIDPAHIIFVDDIQDNVIAVEKAAHKLGIPCDCFHYQGSRKEKRKKESRS